MKTTFISILTAILLGFASRSSGHHFDSADFTAILFTTGLVAWTLAQYSHRPRPLNFERPTRLSVAQSLNHEPADSLPMAA